MGANQIDMEYLRGKGFFLFRPLAVTLGQFLDGRMRDLPAVEELPLADLGLDFPERRFGLLLRRADGLPNAFPFPVVVDDVLISSFLDSHSWSPFLAMSVDKLHDVFRVETH